MATRQLSTFFLWLRQTVSPAGEDTLTDAQLLDSTLVGMVEAKWRLSLALALIVGLLASRATLLTWRVQLRQ